jgi:excisionase family DNA binding protein
VTTAQAHGLLTVEEAAGWLRISRWSVYYLIRDGHLRTIKIGRRRLVTRAALAGCVELLAKDAA